MGFYQGINWNISKLYPTNRYNVKRHLSSPEICERSLGRCKKSGPVLLGFWTDRSL